MSPLRDAFAQQAAWCEQLGSPLTARLCRALDAALGGPAAKGRLARHLRDWPGDPGPAGASLPLRLCAALHGLVLDGRAPALARACAGEGDLDREVFVAVQGHEDRILEWIAVAPQTNEVARSAVLIAAGGFLAEQAPGVRFDLLELGASAGLNLNFPIYILDTEHQNADLTGAALTLSPEWRGEGPPRARLPVGAREGVDLNPLDPRADGPRLLAHVWADQQPRLARMRRALEIARRDPARVDRGCAGDWLAARLAAPAVQGRLVFHTIAAQYFPAAVRARVEAALREGGARAGATRPLAHLSMELEDGAAAALRLRLWQGGPSRAWDLGRADPHARWIEWRPQPCAGGW